MLGLLWIVIVVLVEIGLFAIHPLLGVLGILIPIALLWSWLKN